MSIRIIALLIAAIASLPAADASVPIIVSGGAGRRAVGNLCNKAENQLKMSDVSGAKRSVDAALQADPKFWPALYIRAKIFLRQDQYQLAIADCNEALRHIRVRAGFSFRCSYQRAPREIRGSIKRS